MGEKQIIKAATKIEQLKAELQQFATLVSAQECPIAYAADLPYTSIDGTRESIQPNPIKGSNEDILEHILNFYQNLDYRDKEQHEKNTARTVGFVHLACDEATQLRIIQLCAKIQITKNQTKSLIGALSELERQKLKRTNPDLARINFQHVYRAIQAFSLPIHSASFTWLAHSSTVKTHTPAAYLVYLNRVKAGLHGALLKVAANDPVAATLEQQISEADADINTIQLHQHRDTIYVRREVPPHPRVRIGVCHKQLSTTKEAANGAIENYEIEYALRPSSVPIITFANPQVDQLPDIVELGICPAPKVRTKKRDDFTYTPILEHRNVYVKDAR